MHIPSYGHAFQNVRLEVELPIPPWRPIALLLILLCHRPPDSRRSLPPSILRFARMLFLDDLLQLRLELPKKRNVSPAIIVNGYPGVAWIRASGACPGKRDS